VYSVTILGSGKVQFFGAQNVTQRGRAVSQIPPERVAELARLIDNSGFWSAVEKFLSFAQHEPKTTLSVVSNGRQQTVWFCWASWIGSDGQGTESDVQGTVAVQELSELADTIESVSGALKWVGAPPGQ
jgi:hypothetical protein